MWNVFTLLNVAKFSVTFTLLALSLKNFVNKLAQAELKVGNYNCQHGKGISIGM